MKKHSLNLSFLLLQGLLVLIECIAVAYISPILVSLGYSSLGIGRVMTLAALAAMLARPVWGYLNDRFACARRVTLVASAVGIICYSVLVLGGGRSFAVTVTAVMGLYVTTVCMMNFADTWAMRLISGGAELDYGGTRAGGSLSYAFGALGFGALVARWGFRPGPVILWVLFALLVLVVCRIPDPEPSPRKAARPMDTLRENGKALAGNRRYRTMLAAYFLCTISACAVDSFNSVLILSLGGTELHVGMSLFLQAVCELPVMIGYTRIRNRLHADPARLMACAMLFYGLRALVLGFADGLWVPLAAAMLQTFSFALFTPACVDFMLRTVPADTLSTAHLGFLALGQGASSMLGNALCGTLSVTLGLHGMFRLISLPAFCGALLARQAAKSFYKK